MLVPRMKTQTSVRPALMVKEDWGHREVSQITIELGRVTLVVALHLDFIKNYFLSNFLKFFKFP